MPLDPYAACSCGSGKKYRWCCEPIERDLRRAYEQEANGQHDTALRIIDEIVAAHPGNPQGYGRKAELLYKLARTEEAEAALEKAFAINPNYPYGLLLRSAFRLQEGEMQGALLLARRAAEVFDPGAHDYLAEIFHLIFECEMALNRPAAAREALRRAMHYAPAAEEVRARFEAAFGEQSRLPLAARRDYRPVGPPPPSDPARRAAWNKALGNFESGRLSELSAALDQLVTEAPDDTAGWFYVGLARTWLGDNLKALEAFDRYIERETDEERASAAAALQEVLRCGFGLQEIGDYREYAFLYQFRDQRGLEVLLQEWAQSHRLVPLQTRQEGTFAGLLIDLTTPGLITAGAPPSDTGRFAGYILVTGNIVRVTSPLKESYDHLKDEVRQRLNLGLTELKESQGPIQFPDVVADGLAFPLAGDEKQATERVRKHVQRYYEETWPHKPRKALAGNTPIDAAGHPVLRRKLLGVIRFIEDCAAGGLVSAYDFNQLRRKLGLASGASAGEVASGSSGATPTGDIAAMGAAELGGLAIESLAGEQLEQAWQAAQKIDANELATRFAKALLARPADQARPDRYPVFNYLTQRALQEGDLGSALDWVNEGQKSDCEHNDGRRRNDYELRRGQVHVKRGEADEAHDIFQRLIERAPSETRFRIAAVEAMLSLRQGARALAFAEAGLEAARKQNDRDSAGHLQELAAAARKQSS
jgi:tetratricopeptide (TPR) repeat protein